MQFLKINRSAMIILVIGIILVVGLAGEYILRCYGKPLSREEAIKRGSLHIQILSNQYDFGESVPPLVSEEYDAFSKSWTFKYQNASCSIILDVDRCYGTDLRGTTCPIRR
jgi:hypothetical protein